jgi:tetratricopeptide (TPR) repeat protein
MKNTKTIETFLNREMSELERKEFIEEMRQNKSLAVDVALYEEVNEAIIDDQVFEFRKTLKEIIVVSRDKQAISLQLSRKLIKYPLVASICILISFSLWQVLSVVQPDKVFVKFYKPYETGLTTRSASVSEDKSTVAIQLYENKEYEASFEILSNYLVKNFGDQTARFYYAMNSLELNKMDIAIAELQQVEKDQSSNYSLHAKWYLSLAYLKMNNKDEAIKYLRSIAKDDNYYSERAQAILKKF